MVFFLGKWNWACGQGRKTFKWLKPLLERERWSARRWRRGTKNTRGNKSRQWDTQAPKKKGEKNQDPSLKIFGRNDPIGWSLPHSSLRLEIGGLEVCVGIRVLGCAWCDGSRFAKWWAFILNWWWDEDTVVSFFRILRRKHVDTKEADLRAFVPFRSI